MGHIKTDVINSHFRVYPEQREFADAFIHTFDINYGTRLNATNTHIFCFLLSPDKSLSNMFGFDDEILLVYSPFAKIEPRTIQAIEHAFTQQPFRSRANPLAFILLTESSDAYQWVEKYLVDHPQFRTPVILNKEELLNNKLSRWYVRNKLSQQLFTRDIFDYQLPLDSDMYFFGRGKIVDEFVDSARKAQNRGLFGLRKTGKTSLLFKVRRVLEESGIATVLYIDCKRHDIRSRRWDSLLTYITERILTAFSKKNDMFRKLSPVERFERVIREIGGSKNICLIFDEIEYITPFAVLDTHWKVDFTNLWQILWSAQSEHRRLAVIMAGVNPYITEIDLINGVQNPVFGIVKSVMLTGLSREDSDRMISRIGRQMGLLFEEKALSYLHSRYGGHPLLTRMACSYTNQELVAKNVERPTQILEKHLKDREADRDSELQFYCRHIVSELKEFYKAEYDILLMLAEGSVVDVIELSAEPEWTKHLKGYGVLNFSQTARPSFKIPVLERYLAYETARERGTNEPRHILPAERRAEWLQRRKSGIISEYRSLLKALSAAGKVLPYGSEFLPESHRISECKVCNNWDDFVGFITSVNLALCETIDDAHGKGYFFGGLKSDYTSLFSALLRIRTYRNNADHLRLNRAAESAFRQFIEVDFRGRELSAVKDPWFALQQVALDELFGALLIEINRLR